MAKNKLPFSKSEREQLVDAAQSAYAAPAFDGFWEQVERDFIQLTEVGEVDNLVQPKH